MLDRCVTRDEAVNALFENVDSTVKPAEMLTYVSLFSQQHELGDFVKVLDRYTLSQEPKS